MKQKDKNIFIVIIFIIIFLLVWTLTNYNSTKKDTEDEEILDSQQEQEDTTTDLEKLREEKESNKLIPTISVTDLNKKMLIDDAIVIIDARSAEAFNNGHIRDSFHITEFDATRQHRTIVFVTSTGDEDTLTTHYRTISDTNKVYNLTGGFSAWEKSGRGTIALDIEHTFDNQAKIQLVEPRDLDELLINSPNDKLVVIDTRRSGNYAKGHIQGALNIPFVEIERRYKEIPIAKKIYVYGTDEDASFDAGVLLHDLGFIGAKTINGGFTAWTEYGYPITQ